ncbi:hypothetical protein F5B20DRAFT_590256 [Whalleya microplaca]|nr:hypothetical protein F5B20DRAFT_590256 [Whalleya microplaca]
MAASTSSEQDKSHLTEFKWSPSLVSFLLKESLSPYESIYDQIAVGAIVFNASGDRVLLMQRTSSGTFPKHWEIPGGMCTLDDENVLSATSLELLESTGLRVKYARKHVGDESFAIEPANTVCRHNFVVDVERKEPGETDVKINTLKYRSSCWASKEESQGQEADWFRARVHFGGSA